MRFFSQTEVYDSISPTRARLALAAVLQGDFDPESDTPRTITAAGTGELLSMPSAIPGWTGAKLITVAPDNPSSGLPRIQGVYVLFDTATMAPRAIIDGNSLTLLRTPAMSALVADYWAHPDAHSLLLVGTGPQAIAHAQFLAEVRPLDQIWVRGRSSTDAAVDKLRAMGLNAHRWAPGARADIVACCTSAQQPVIDAEDLNDGAFVIAMGSHSPAAREVPTDIMANSRIVIESRATTLREGGDVIIPLREGAISADDLVTVKDVVSGGVEREWTKPAVFKGTGMSWQDLAVASCLVN
ncbi:ornithine cyclodeaminase family protein [Staphylococcus chromogenes]|nr:ornithine cyclodeaminase family protein [Staphylococcus chromogenes]